jgi:hypothetical protein
MSHKVTAQVDYYSLRILIDGFLHCYLERPRINAIGSYKDGSLYYIEIRFKRGTPQINKYESRELWFQVLKALNKNL